MPDAGEANKRIIGVSAAGRALVLSSQMIAVMPNGILDGRTDPAHTAAMWINKTQCSPDLAATKSSFLQDPA